MTSQNAVEVLHIGSDK